ncbi:hypothetical protein LUZ61_005033 [Rhynchospora tenuis]|uniref:Leucine-rich repeat-containing N-terminal plant-type domain-containing protein n=1 Tax=Rhynchospora tenuis TaxID=198213 RepID=A0AAD5ZP14_9POAL|nr:hypothetical protein LUZ61_005033 [Rhynchospora tenuis]
MSIILLVWFLSCISSSSSTKDDELALLKIKKQLGYPDILSSWVEGFEFCNAWNVSWSITCTSTGRIRSLGMTNLDVPASFPDAICELTEVEDLGLYMNPGLYGPIPSCITKLDNLRSLVIIETSVSGSIPGFINNTNLIMIILRNNHLSGEIPPSLSTLTNLDSLDLSSNNLTGTIPPSLSTLQKLHYLRLSSNYLTGNIPSGLVHGWTNYLELDLSNNNLTGEIPRCYGWIDFTSFDVGNNQLSGDASFLFGKQKRAFGIVLANNEFEFDMSYIEIPKNLYKLELNHNKIYGKIPDSIKSAPLYDLDLSFNRLCGEIPQGGNMQIFNATAFANNTCLCGYPLPPCSTYAPAPAPILEAAFDSSP